MSGQYNLKIDWATHEAARYSCENWHYSKCVPIGKVVKIGVWECGVFIGCVLFSTGASPQLHKAFGLTRFEVCELVRVALKKHQNTVSKIVSIAIKFLKRQSPMLRLIVSFADPDKGHIGCIYQAGNWIYVGQSTRGLYYKLKDGSITHNRNLAGPNGFVSLGTNKQKKENQAYYRKKLNYGLMSGEIVKIETSPKFKYLMPLDEEIRRRIIPLSKPYPKRAQGDTKDTPGNLPGEGGSTPTCALQPSSGNQ